MLTKSLNTTDALRCDIEYTSISVYSLDLRAGISKDSLGLKFSVFPDFNLFSHRMTCLINNITLHITNDQIQLVIFAHANKVFVMVRMLA